MIFLDRCCESLHRREPSCWGKNRDLCSTLYKYDCSAPASREVKLNWQAVILVIKVDFLKIYRHIFFLLRYEAAVELCECLLESCPMNCQLLEALVALYLQTNQHDKARAVWLTAFEKNPQNAEVFYHTCKFFIMQVKMKWLRMFKCDVFMFHNCLNYFGHQPFQDAFTGPFPFANYFRYSFSLCCKIPCA